MFEIHFRMLRYIDKSLRWTKHLIIVTLLFQIYCSNDIFLTKMINNAKSISGLVRKKKAGAWSPPTFFYSRRMVSYR